MSTSSTSNQAAGKWVPLCQRPFDEYGENDWLTCLLKDPERYAPVCNWDKLGGSHWARLLVFQPQLAVHCDWTKLRGRSWVTLIIMEPQFAILCDWSQLNGMDWVRLLLRKMEYHSHCNWDNIDVLSIISLMSHYPELMRQEKIQITAVTKSVLAFPKLVNPTDTVVRLHSLLWKI